MKITMNVGKVGPMMFVTGLCALTGYLAYRGVQAQKKVEEHKSDILKHTPILSLINDASFKNSKVELPEDKAFIKNYLTKKYNKAMSASSIKDFDNLIEDVMNLCTNLVSDDAATYLAYLKLQEEEAKEKRQNDISLQQAKEIASAIKSVGSSIDFVVRN